MYREYGIQGRWPSPDPLGPGAFSLADPQSLNRYAYVLNNPETFVDPLGLHCGDPDSVGNGPNGAVKVTGYSPCPVLNPAELTYCPAPSGSPLGNDGGVQPEPAEVCRLQEGPLNDNMMGSSRGYGSEAEFSNALLQRVQNHPGTPQSPTPPKTPTLSPGPPGVPPNPLACSPYLDGTGAGQILFDLCSKVFPNGPWSNCVRGKLLNLYVPNGNPFELTWYLVADHPYDFATCGVE